MKILSIKEIAPALYDVWVESPEMAKKALPGQFLHIDCGGTTTLRRPISICDASENALRFVFAAKGEGTKTLAQRSVGDELDILGPLGTSFKTENAGKAVLIGGGIGVFPLLLLAKKLDNPTAVLGFRTKDLVVMEEEFKAVCDEVKIATDDGSYGFHGLVTQLVEGKVDTIYACGPKPMLKAVKALAAELGAACQISLEERMGCGIGACAVCVCKTKGGKYSRVCKDGPVYDAEGVDLDA